MGQITAKFFGSRRVTVSIEQRKGLASRPHWPLRCHWPFASHWMVAPKKNNRVGQVVHCDGIVANAKFIAAPRLSLEFTSFARVRSPLRSRSRPPILAPPLVCGLLLKWPVFRLQLQFLQRQINRLLRHRRVLQPASRKILRPTPFPPTSSKTFFIITSMSLPTEGCCPKKI